MKIRLSHKIPANTGVIYTKIQTLESALCKGGVENKKAVIRRIKQLIGAYNRKSPVKIYRIAYKAMPVKKMTPEQIMHQYNILVAKARNCPDATNIQAVKYRIDALAKAYNGMSFDFRHKHKHWLKNIVKKAVGTAKNVVHDVAKVAKKVIKAAANIEGDVLFAPLTPFRGVMKKALEKKGIKPDKSTPMLAKQFVQYVVNPAKHGHFDATIKHFGELIPRFHSFNGSTGHKGVRHHRSRIRAKGMAGLVHTFSVINPEGYNNFIRPGGGRRITMAHRAPVLRMQRVAPLIIHHRNSSLPPMGGGKGATPWFTPGRTVNMAQNTVSGIRPLTTLPTANEVLTNNSYNPGNPYNPYGSSQPWSDNSGGGGGYSGGGGGGDSSGSDSSDYSDEINQLNQQMQDMQDELNQQTDDSGLTDGASQDDSGTVAPYAGTADQVSYIQEYLNAVNPGLGLPVTGIFDGPTEDAWTSAGFAMPVSEDDWQGINTGQSFEKYNIIDDIVTIILDFIKGLKSKKEAADKGEGPALTPEEQAILSDSVAASNTLMNAAQDTNPNSYQEDQAQAEGPTAAEMGGPRRPPFMERLFSPLGIGIMIGVVAVTLIVVVIVEEKPKKAAA